MSEWLIVLLIILQFADYWTTRRVIEAGGREVNVVLLYWRGLLDRLGVPGEFTWLWSVKLATALLLLYALAVGISAHPLPMILLVAVTVFYGWVVVNNYRVMMTLKGRTHG